MTKPVIGIDIDDVISDTAEGFLGFSNEQYGTNLTIDDYSEHWAQMWRVDMKEVERRTATFNTAGVVQKYRHKEEAKAVLVELSKKYRLLALTSRNSKIKQQTIDWVELHYAGIFEDIQFAGIFDGPLHEGMLTMTKAHLFASNNVRFVIDDQLKHCIAAAELGIEAVLFGDYPWNKSVDLSKHVTRCHDWHAVQRYFDARS